MTSQATATRVSARRPVAIDVAFELLRAGDWRSAAGACSAILAADPQHGPALQLLGVIYAQRGDSERSEDLLRRAMKAMPASAEAANNLGMSLYGQGKHENAVTCFQRAVTLKPDYPIALNNLGAAQMALGRDLEALQWYERAIVVAPSYPEASKNCGTLLLTMGRFADAVRRLQAAFKLRPADVEVRVALGMALAKLQRVTEATTCFTAVLELEPDNAAAHVGLGELLQSAAKHEAAIGHYEIALRLEPENASVHAKLGSALQERGRLIEAGRSYERSIDLEPACPSHYLFLTRVRSMTLEDHYFRQLLQLGERITTLPDSDQIDLHFALGKACSDVGDHETAFKHLLAGNSLKRLKVPYDEHKSKASIDRILQVFTPSVLSSCSAPQDLGAHIPIFIVGMPRSGSTLVEQILASHPLVFGAGETRSFVEACKSIKLFTSTLPYPEAVPSLGEAAVSKLATNYTGRLKRLAAAQAGQEDVTHVTDKMLANFRYIGLIKMALPHARIIHIHRDPVETCLSCFSIQFKSLAFSYDLGELGRRYHDYSCLMAHWQSILPESTMIDVRYEALVQDFDHEVRRIIDYCGLSWHDQCARFYDTTRLVRTASVAQVRQPLYRHALKRWRPDQAILKPLLDGLAGLGAETTLPEEPGRMHHLRSEACLASPAS